MYSGRQKTSCVSLWWPVCGLCVRVWLHCELNIMNHHKRGFHIAAVQLFHAKSARNSLWIRVKSARNRVLARISLLFGVDYCLMVCWLPASYLWTAISENCVAMPRKCVKGSGCEFIFLASRSDERGRNFGPVDKARGFLKCCIADIRSYEVQRFVWSYWAG